MSIAHTLAARIAAIIPRLASDHDGEVVASARAIDRTLRGAGADWHDVAAAFERGSIALEGPKVSGVTGLDDPPTWRSLSIDERDAWLNALLRQQDLSPWARGFLESIHSKHRLFRMSPKQQKILDEMIADGWDWGVWP